MQDEERPVSVWRRRLRVVGWLLLAACGALALAAAFAWWDPTYEPPQVKERVSVPERTPATIRLMTLNLAHGRGTAFNQILTRTRHIQSNLDAAATLIQAVDADVVALQELDGPSSWSGGFDHLAYLAERVGYAHSYHGLHVDRDRPRIAYGTGVLSRFPLREERSRAFDLNWLDTKGFVHVVVEAPGLEVAVVSVHLDFKRDRERRRQLQILTDQLENGLGHPTRPLVVTGDFNCSPADPSGVLQEFLDHHRLRAAGDLAPTFPSDQPNKSLDHVLLRGLRVTCTEVVDVLVSDHRPLLVELGAGE